MLAPAIGPAVGGIHAQATSLAFQDAVLIIATVFLVTVLPALLLARGRTTA